MHIWRISSFASLDGEGGLYQEGRWHRKGQRIVYCSDHPSTALLETLVHAGKTALLGHFQLLKIHLPEDIPLLAVDPGAQYDDLAWSQAVGADILGRGHFCLFSAPSVIMPQARNIMFNPDHHEAGRIQIEQIFIHPFDRRLAG